MKTSWLTHQATTLVFLKVQSCVKILPDFRYIHKKITTQNAKKLI